MKDAGHRACVEAALNHEKGDWVPVNNFALATAARSCNVDLEVARWNPEISAKVAVDYSMRTMSDFVKPMIDSQVPFADLGMEVVFPQDDYGMIPNHLVETSEDIDRLELFDAYDPKTCPKFTLNAIDSLEETVRILPEDLHICGLSWGPISTAGYIMGAENLMMSMLMEPEVAKQLIAKVTPFIGSMHKRMVDAGASVMWMADPTSSEDLISPSMFSEFSSDYIREVVSTVKAHADVPAFVHICGNTLETMKLLPATGADCLSFDHAVDIEMAKRNAGKDIAIMGNLDPVGMLMAGTPEAIASESKRILDIAGQDGGFILAPGCETPQTTADENVLAMCRTAREYGF